MLADGKTLQLKKASSNAKAKNEKLKEQIKSSAKKQNKQLNRRVHNKQVNKNVISHNSIKADIYPHCTDEGSNLGSLQKLLSEDARNRLSDVVEKSKECNLQEIFIVPNQDPIDEEYFHLGGGSQQSSPTKSASNSENKYVLANYDKPLLNSKKTLSNLLIQERNSTQNLSTSQHKLSEEEKKANAKMNFEGAQDRMGVSSPEGNTKLDPPLLHKQIRLLK